MNNNPISVKCGSKGSRRGRRGAGNSSKASAGPSGGGGPTARLTSAQQATSPSPDRKSTGTGIKAQAKPGQQRHKNAKSQTTSIAECVPQPTPADLARPKDKDKEDAPKPQAPREVEQPAPVLKDPSRQDAVDDMLGRLSKIKNTIHDQRILRQLACDIQNAQGELDALVEVEKDKQEQVEIEETLVETLVMEGPSHRKVDEEFGYCKVLARPPLDFRKWFWSYFTYCFAKSYCFGIFSHVLGEVSLPWWLRKISEFWLDRTAEHCLVTFYPQSQEIARASKIFYWLSWITTAFCPTVSSHTIFKFEVGKALSAVLLVLVSRLTEGYWTKNLWRVPSLLRTPANFLLGTAGYRYHSVHYVATAETVLVGEDKRSSIVSKDALAHKYITLRKYERTVDVMEDARWVQTTDFPNVLVEAATDANLPALLTQHGTRESLKARLDRTLQSYNIANYDKKAMYDNDYIHSSTQDYVYARAEHNLEKSVDLDFRIAPALATMDIDQVSFSNLNQLTSSTQGQKSPETPLPSTGSIDVSFRPSASLPLLGLLGLSLMLILFQRKQGQLRDFAEGLLNPMRDCKDLCSGSYQPSLDAISAPSLPTPRCLSKAGWTAEIIQLGEKLSSWLLGMLATGKCWIETLLSSLSLKPKLTMKPSMLVGSMPDPMSLSASLDPGFKRSGTLFSPMLRLSRKFQNLSDPLMSWERFIDLVPNMVSQIIQLLKATLITLSSAFSDSCTRLYSVLFQARPASLVNISATFRDLPTLPISSSFQHSCSKLSLSTPHA